MEQIPAKKTLEKQAVLDEKEIDIVRLIKEKLKTAPVLHFDEKTDN